MSEAGVVFHLPENWIAQEGDGSHLNSACPEFYKRALTGLREQRVPVSTAILDRETLRDRIETDSKFHVIHEGALRHERAMIAAPAYVAPFWHLDADGGRRCSSIAEKTFQAHPIDKTRATNFFNAMRQVRVTQPPAEVADGSLLVLFQKPNATLAPAYIDRFDMLETALAHWSGPVLLRLHPEARREEDVMARIAALQETHPNLTLTEAHITALLPAVSRVLSVNSGMTLEAYLHRTPAILCGKADFHHIADTARSTEALEEILKAPSPGRATAKYLYWYFAQNCLSANAYDLPDQIIRRIHARGYEIYDLVLS